MYGTYFTVDPQDMEARYSVEDSVAFIGQLLSGPSEETKRKIRKVKQIMDELPAFEADIVELYYFRDRKQTEIAKLFRVRQPTIHYRLRKASERIRFILDMPDVDPDKMRADLEKVLDDPVNVHIMMLMVETTCQTEVAGILGISQGKVRHRFYSIKERLAGMEGYEDYVTMFNMVADNPNKLHEVYKTGEDARVTHMVL